VAGALARGARITGTQRAELADQLGQRYAAGESIRAIAEGTGRSFGFVHGLVKESGVELRSRGGATRGPAARSAAAASTATGAPAGNGTSAQTGPAVGTKIKAKVEPAAKTGAKAKAKAEGKAKAKAKKPGKKGKR